MGKLLTMSEKEITRKEIIDKTIDKRMLQREAAEALGISERHLRRLLHAYRKIGTPALISKHRGRKSNNQITEILKQEITALLHSQYWDYGPTLASEKLLKKHHIKISKESVRKILISEGMWKPRRQKKARVHQSRERRAREGELVQIDGSPHAWFEDRGPKCDMLLAVDDATGKIMRMHFSPTETTAGYFTLVRGYIEQHGLPVAFYSDKNGIFKVNHKHAITGNGMTQFGRAMKQLDIEIICANTPQAKGRVERANLTLQDRLVKEFREHNISDIEQANNFIPSYIQEYNQKFAVQPRSAHYAHRENNFSKLYLDQIFSFQETRTISNNLQLQYKNIVYQIQTSRPSYALRNARVTIVESPNGTVKILYKGKILNYSIYVEQEKQAVIVPAKNINHYLDSKPKIPAKNHPWRTYGNHLNGKPIQPDLESSP